MNPDQTAPWSNLIWFIVCNIDHHQVNQQKNLSCITVKGLIGTNKDASIHKKLRPPTPPPKKKNENPPPPPYFVEGVISLHLLVKALHSIHEWSSDCSLRICLVGIKSNQFYWYKVQSQGCHQSHVYITVTQEQSQI